MNDFLMYRIVLYCALSSTLKLIRKITTSEKKLVALNNKFCWFRMARAKPFKGKTSKNPVKPENSIKIKKL